MPSQEEYDRYIRHNEVARKADLEADKRLTMEERLAQAVQLSRLGTEMAAGLRRHAGPQSR